MTPAKPPGVPPVVTGDDVASPLELVLPRGVVVRMPDRFDAKVRIGVEVSEQLDYTASYFLR